MKITINNKTYEVIKNEKDAIDEEVLKEAITEYFENPCIYYQVLGNKEGM